MRFAITLILCCFAVYALSQDVVTINGKCPVIKDGMEISLTKVLPRRFDRDTKEIKTTSVNHSFTFKVPAAYGEYYFLQANGRNTRLYLEPGNVDVVIEDSLLNKATVKGNTTGVQYKEFETKLINTNEAKAHYAARVKYFRYYGNGNNRDTLERLQAVIDSLSVPKQQRDIELTTAFIKSHRSSYLNTYILYNQIDEMPGDSLRTLYKLIPQRNLSNTWGKELKYRIDSLFVGSKAPSFTQADTAGKRVTLNSFAGKYVLIDFWASWCLPCRADNPNLVKAMEQYAGKNFTIVSVSLDVDKAKWLQAIKKDGLSGWTHVSDLAQFRNEVSKKYYVYAVPANYLIDLNGVIVAKNLKGEELLKKLEQLLK